MVLAELWKEKISRNRIAAELNLPHAEVENLLFGLTGEVGPPPVPGGKASLKTVR